MATWIYDVKTCEVSHVLNSEKVFGGAWGFYKLPEGTIENGMIYIDDMERYLEFYERVQQGEKNLEIEVRKRNFRTGTMRWLRLGYTSVPDTSGRPCHAIGTAVDITAEKNAREHLNKALAVTNKVCGGNLVGVLLYNATTGLVIQHDPKNLKDRVLEKGESIQLGIQEIAENILDEKDRKRWIEIHDCDKIRNLYR